MATDVYKFEVQHITRTSFIVNGIFYRWRETDNQPCIDDTVGETKVYAPTIQNAIGQAIERHLGWAK